MFKGNAVKIRLISSVLLLFAVTNNSVASENVQQDIDYILNVTIDTPMCTLHIDDNTIYLGSETSNALKENRTQYTSFTLYFSDCNNTTTGKIYFDGEYIREANDGSIYLENKDCQSCSKGVSLKLYDDAKTPLTDRVLEISLTEPNSFFTGYVRPVESYNEKITAGVIDTSVRIVVQYN